jgi:hypothetical protein
MSACLRAVSPCLLDVSLRRVFCTKLFRKLVGIIQGRGGGMQLWYGLDYVLAGPMGMGRTTGYQLPYQSYR